MLFPIVVLASMVTNILANTEKTIFLGPSSLQIPIAHPTLEDLNLDTLSPQLRSIRTHLHAEFPTDNLRRGPDTWLLLSGLQEGKRYEVRVCWAATQPTAFHLQTHQLSTVFDNSVLITSLAKYSDDRQTNSLATEEQKLAREGYNAELPGTTDRVSSVLFLQISAAADYYTTNQTLMKHVPPVFVDIILDPYLFNIFPQSLLPTAAYILILAIGSWYLAKYIGTWLQDVSINVVEPSKKKS